MNLYNIIIKNTISQYDWITSVSLNYSGFYYEFRNNSTKACKTAEEAHNEDLKESLKETGEQVAILNINLNIQDTAVQKK